MPHLRSWYAQSMPKCINAGRVAFCWNILVDTPELLASTDLQYNVCFISGVEIKLMTLIFQSNSTPTVFNFNFYRYLNRS